MEPINNKSSEGLPPVPPESHEPVNFTEYTAFSNPSTGGSVGAPPSRIIPENQPIESSSSSVQSMSEPKRHSRWWIWLIIGMVVFCGIIGGGYYAYSKGLIELPFLPVPIQSVMSKMSKAGAGIETARYTMSLKMKTEVREAGVSSLPATTNGNINSALDGTFNQLGGTPNTLTELNLAIVLSLSGEMKKSLSDSAGSMVLTASSKDTEVVDLEVRKIGKSLYLIANKLPTIGFFDLSSLTGKWVAVTPENSAGFIDSLINNINTNSILSTDKKDEVQNKLLKTGAISLKRMKSEAVGGVKCSHYSIEIKAEKIPEAVKIMIDNTPQSGTDAVDFQKSLSELQKPENMDTLKAMINNTNLEIWLEKGGQLRQIRVHSAIVPPEGTTGFDGKQLSVDMITTLDQVNEKIAVEVPTQSVSFMDLLGQLGSGIVGNVNEVINANVSDGNTNTLTNIDISLGNTNSHPIDNTNTSLLNTNENKNTPRLITPAIAKAQDGQIKTDLRQFQTALVLYADDNNGKYPVDKIIGKPDVLSTIIYDKYLSGYLSASLVSPSDNDYMYLANSDSSKYVIYARLGATGNYFWFTSAGESGETATVPDQGPYDSNILDSDNDGLIDSQEVIYKTDPNDADTDGDGFSDGQEVDSGFDPLVKFSPTN